MHRAPVAALSLAVTLLATDTPAAHDAVITGRFDGKTAEGWKIHSGWRDPAGLRCATPDEPRGLYFVTQGISRAYAPWHIGTQPFELWFEIEMDRGNEAAWRWPGVAVAVTSGIPGAMEEQDVALACSVHQQGVICAVRQGGLYRAAEKRPTVWHFADRSASPRYILNQGGAGGHDYSIKWPAKKLDGTRLRFHLKRDAGNVLHFTVRHGAAPDGPWWIGRWLLPERLAGVPLAYVAVTTVLNPNSYRDVSQPIRPVDELRGRILNLQGRALGGPARPRLDHYTAETAALRKGSIVTLHGSGFDEGARVEVNGTPLALVDRLGDNELRVTLDHLQADGTNDLAVLSACGLRDELPGGLPYGRRIDRIEPREATPEGGDVVSLVGGGFDRSTRVTVNGNAATVVGVAGPTRMTIRVPPGTTGPAVVRAVSGGDVFSGTPAFGYAPHPYLWFDTEGLAALKRKFQSPQLVDYRRLILEKAEGPREDLGRYGAPNHAAIIHAYLWAYLLSGRQDFKDKLLAAVDALVAGTEALPSEQQGASGHRRRIIDIDEFMCHNGEAIATVYDTLFKELPPEKRTQLLAYLDRHLTYYLGRVKANDWWYRNNPSNTIAVGNGCGGIVALALMHSTSQADSALDAAVKTITEKYRGMAEDGGCVEGNLYWDYGLTYQLLFGHALLGATGEDRGMLTQEKLSRVPEFVETQLGGDGRLFTFNDTQPWLTGLAVCADFGARLDSDLLRWLADRTAHEAATGGTRVFTRPQFYALAFRARDMKPAPGKFPGVPAVDYLRALHWGVLRSDGSAFMPGLVLGVKGRDGATTHHVQEDLGSFVLQARGEALLIDPGYYQGAAGAHSLPVVEGHGPDKRGVATITEAGSADPWRWMAIDATAAYAAAPVERLRRVFVLCGDRAAVVLDDLKPKGRAEARCQYQCAHAVELCGDGRGAIVAGKKTKLSLRTFGPRLKLAVEGPLPFGRSWVFASSDEFAWHRATAGYEANEDTPLVTVLLPFGPSEDDPEVAVKHRGDQISVSLPGPATATFRKDTNGWSFARRP
jgi:hypothetical protein